MDASPTEAWKTCFLMDWQTELCRFSVCENYDSPKIHQWWTALDPHFCQLRFRITSLSWFSSSETTAASKLMINGDCKSLPNLWSQNIPFEAYKWSVSDWNVIYGFIPDLCGYHDVISDFLMDLLQHTPVDSTPQTSTEKSARSSLKRSTVTQVMTTSASSFRGHG